MTTKIFCDIAELDQIKKFNKKKIVKGFITNPSLMWKARSLRGLSDEQYIELNRYTLDLIYHFYSEDSVYQGGSVFECNKLEKKI